MTLFLCSFATSSPTSTTVVPAPNNISCNVPITLTTNTTQNSAQNSAAVGQNSRPAVIRERRQRTAEERRSEGSGRRRSGRNRNSMQLTAATTASPGQQGQGSSKLDLPPGYGKF